ncbi:Glycoside hydrolase, 10 [Dionaea muscipula]
MGHAESSNGGNADFKNMPGETGNARRGLPNTVLDHSYRDFSSWRSNCCKAFVVSIEVDDWKGMLKKLGAPYVVVTDRKDSWQGLELDITSKVTPGLTYAVSASVAVSVPCNDVLATLRLEDGGCSTNYMRVGRISATMEEWRILQGTFTLKTLLERVIFYLEGPSPGVDLFIRSVVISCSSPPSSCKHSLCDKAGEENIILNPTFEDGLNNWSGRGCTVVLHDSMADGKILPQSGKGFAAASGRTQTWNGIQQDITGRVQRKLAYEATAIVRIYGNNITSATVQATLWVQMPDKRQQYIGISSVQATDKDWVQLQGKFLINGSPEAVVIYLEGPPAGIDILINNFKVKHAAKVAPLPRPAIENIIYGLNAVQNSDLTDGTNGWFPLGNCTLSVNAGSPHILPPMARDSLGDHEPLSGRYILVTNRTQNWMGPAQIIKDQLKLFATYQVSAWVKIGPGASSSQNVNVALSVDDRWVNGGQVETNDDRWHEIGGSFRIEKQPSRVMVYIQGPGSGVDLMVAGLQIFAVKRQARFRHLNKQIDKIRKRDVSLKFAGSAGGVSLGCPVKVRQISNSFPIGSCINRTNIDNEDFVAFFTKNFNWAVFGNELKWYWTEAQQGNLNYQDADDMLDLCEKNNIDVRGHCIFWEVEDSVQSWVRALSDKDLMTAVQNRLTSLLTRYKGKFIHYDVNNEMLHGSFYQDRLGKDIRAEMFKKAHQLDPSATLFVNDYHVEDGCDTRSSPEKYIEQVLDLQEQGAPVGGIGIQGHIDSPVGAVVYSALDKLGILGHPIWFTELDVSSANEYIRADDLEVMLREAFAHPAVEGVMLWGFWELFMSRENSWLVNAEGDINEAGKRYLKLKEEWLTHAHGLVDQQGEFRFRGFHGTYEVQIVTPSKTVSKTFVVAKGESSLVLSIDM